MLLHQDFGLVEAEETAWTLSVTCPACGAKNEVSRLPSLRDDPPMTIFLSCQECQAPFRAFGRVTFVVSDELQETL